MDVQTIAVSDIAEVEGFNPRTTAAIEDHLRLVESIKELGVIEPPIVRKEPDGFKLVAGHRRYKAAVDAGLTQLDCIVRSDSIEDSLVISVAENVNRADLDPVDEAMAFKRMRENGLTNKGIAQKVGYDEKLITQRIRILDLPEEIQVMIREKREEFPLSCVKTLVAVAEKHAGLAIVCAEAIAGGRYSVKDFAKDPVPLLAQFQASRSWPAFAVGRSYERKCFGLTEDADRAGMEADELLDYPVGVRFNQEDLDRALGAGVALQGKSPGEGVILDWEFASETASEKLIAFVAEQKAKRSSAGDDDDNSSQGGLSITNRVYDPETKGYTEDPERAKEIRKAERQKSIEEQATGHAFNMDLGAELIVKFERIEPTLQVLKVLSYVGLDEAQDLAFRGLRYCHPAWVEEESSKLKDGRTKTKLIYKDNQGCREAITKYLQNARTADQYAGRVIQLLLANRYADERAVARSNRGGKMPGGGYGALENWTELVDELDAIAKRKLSPTLYTRATAVYAELKGKRYDYENDGGHVTATERPEDEPVPPGSGAEPEPPQETTEED